MIIKFNKTSIFIEKQKNEVEILNWNEPPNWKKWSDG